MLLRAIGPVLMLALSAGGLVTLTSCGPDVPPAGGGTAANSSVSQLTHSPAAPARETGAASLTGANPVHPANFYDSPIPPPDAQWTLLVYTERGPSHVSDANTLKNTLIDKTKRHEWYVIHGADESTIYFGYYRAIDDVHAASFAVAQNDRQFIKDLEMLTTDGQPIKAFDKCGFVPVAAPDPAAPPEWNLFNKDLAKAPKDPTRAYWSLQIMAFKANKLRKEAAVQAVEALRKQGIEAYYYHGDAISSVCVGAWPMDAVQMQKDPGQVARNAGADSTIVVTQGLPEGGEKEIPAYDDQGHRMVVVSPKLIVLDNSMKAMIADPRFASHAVNYVIRTVRGTDGKDHEAPSFLVVIPRAPGNGFYDSEEVTPMPLAAGQDESSVGAGSRSSLFSANNRGTNSKSGNTALGADPTLSPVAPGIGHLRRLGE